MTESGEKRELITREALAARKGVHTRTVATWVEAGCPTHMVDGKQLFWFEETERWLDDHGLTGKPGRPRKRDVSSEDNRSAPPSTTPPAPAGQQVVSGFEQRGPLSTKELKDRADAARRIASAKREEFELQQERGLEELDLADRIRRVKSPDELIDLSLEVMALVSAGRMKHQRGQALRQLLTQAQNAMSARVAETRAEEDGVFLLSPEALELAQGFDKLGNGWRRRWLREALALHRVEDDRELPGWDGHMQPVLQALELDAMGEPVGEAWPARFSPPVVAPALVSPDLPPSLRRDEGGAA